jgi:hypothetical protein
LIYIFAVLLAVGLARYAWQCKHQANFVANINEHVAQTYNRFAKEREANAREVGGEA